MKLRHPHTERPARVCSCLIAIPPEDSGDCVALAGGYYTYDPRTDRFRCEESDIPLEAASYFWATEEDVLTELEVHP